MPEIQQVYNMFKRDDATQNILDVLKENDPKMAENFFHKNDLVGKFIKHEEGGLDLMKQPVCEKCERPGTWSQDGCHCFSCNHDTKDPKKVEDYLMEMLSGMDKNLLRLLKGGK